MKQPDKQKKTKKQTAKSYSCLSCGTLLAGKNRKYCSVDCRQGLRTRLNMHTGLLKALHARYATFYFTELLIIMDLLPYGAKNLFSFIYPRSKGKKPGNDFSQMATALGKLWWDEKKKTKKNSH
jgi:hypothetical protein